MWAVVEAIIIGQMDASISVADRMTHIQRTMERFQRTVMHERYAPTFLLKKMKEKHRELKRDLDRLDFVDGLG
jgi:hypothetical protein